MTPRILVAGVGNIFRGDDAFGVEVVRRLLARPRPDGVRVADFGIRGHDLAYTILDGYDVVILVDATSRGGEPGTLYTLELDPERETAHATPGGHSVDLPAAFRLVRELGGTFPRLCLVGCEPAELGSAEEGAMGLSEPVAAAVERTVALVEELVAEVAEISAGRPSDGRRDVTDIPLTPPTEPLAEMSYEEAEVVLRILAGQNGGSTVASPTPAPAESPPSAALFLRRFPSRPLTSDVLRALVEAVPDAVVVTNADGRIVFVNAQTERLFGYQKDELLGHPIELLVPERIRDKHVGERTGYAKEPHIRPMGKGRELSGRRKDGHEVPVEIGLSPLKTDSGMLVVASVRDVTERRRAEGQLRKMEKRYRTLVEGIPAVTFMAAMDDSEERELYVSPQIVELLGFSQKEWLENPILWYTQLHPDDQVRWHQEFARTVATGERFQSVYRFIARDGRVVWVRGEAKLFRDQAGRPLFLQGIAFDITEIKEANVTLERRVAERTAEVEAHALELARSNRDLELFAATASHDLKKPLGHMTDKLEELAKTYRSRTGPSEQETCAALNVALGRSADMTNLINGLLQFSQVRTDRNEPVPTSCAEAIAQARERLQGEIDQSGGVIDCSTLPAALVVLADKEQLTRLFQNLIGNSLKFRARWPPPLVQIQRPVERDPEVDHQRPRQRDWNCREVASRASRWCRTRSRRSSNSGSNRGNSLGRRSRRSTPAAGSACPPVRTSSSSTAAPSGALSPRGKTRAPRSSSRCQRLDE